ASLMLAHNEKARLSPGSTLTLILRETHAYCSSFAVIEIFAFKTLDTGQPFSAASAYFWKVAASAPGTRPTTSRWLAVMVQPESSFSRESVTFVLMLSGVRLAPPNWADNAIEKHAAWAAAINSSGLVPGAFSKRVVNE